MRIVFHLDGWSLAIFVYDINNRMVSKTIEEGWVVTYSYTAAGMRETVTDSRGVTSYVYDERDHLIQEMRPDRIVPTYTYDSNGNHTSVGAPMDIADLFAASRLKNHRRQNSAG